MNGKILQESFEESLEKRENDITNENSNKLQNICNEHDYARKSTFDQLEGRNPTNEGQMFKEYDYACPVPPIVLEGSNKHLIDGNDSSNDSRIDREQIQSLDSRIVRENKNENSSTSSKERNQGEDDESHTNDKARLLTSKELQNYMNSARDLENNDKVQDYLIK